MSHICATTAALLAACIAFSGPAAAHDSWLTSATGTLALSTGAHFPAAENGPPADVVRNAGCTDGVRRTPLRAGSSTPRALALVPVAAEGATLLACWADIDAHEITLEGPVVDAYFEEIRPSAEMRARWRALQARGVGWQERYTKHARIELAAASAADVERRVAVRRPVGQGLEIVVLGSEPLRVRQPTAFQVLRDGAPLPGFAVQLVSERSRIGIWGTTDAQGTVTHTLPFGGRWLLRGTHLEASARNPDAWDSRFVTLAIELAR
jgi:hypothetical protein